MKKKMMYDDVLKCRDEGLADKIVRITVSFISSKKDGYAYDLSGAKKLESVTKVLTDESKTTKGKYAFKVAKNELFRKIWKEL